MSTINKDDLMATAGFDLTTLENGEKEKLIKLIDITAKAAVDIIKNTEENLKLNTSDPIDLMQKAHLMMGLCKVGIAFGLSRD